MKTEADYTLPKQFVNSVVNMGEFRPGGTIVSVKLKDGTTVSGLLISTYQWFIGHGELKDIPFDVSDIEEVFQTSEEKESGTPEGGWTFWETGCKAANLRK